MQRSGLRRSRLAENGIRSFPRRHPDESLWPVPPQPAIFSTGHSLNRVPPAASQMRTNSTVFFTSAAISLISHTDLMTDFGNILILRWTHCWSFSRTFSTRSSNSSFKPEGMSPSDRTSCSASRTLSAWPETGETLPLARKS